MDEVSTPDPGSYCDHCAPRSQTPVRFWTSRSPRPSRRPRVASGLHRLCDTCVRRCVEARTGRHVRG